ncbi:MULTISPECIES: hypothetical protein [Novilysobacter]
MTTLCLTRRPAVLIAAVLLLAGCQSVPDSSRAAFVAVTAF